MLQVKKSRSKKLLIFGLLPAATSIGIGSETSRPLAIVVIGGLITATVLTLFIFPIIFKGVYSFKPKRFGS
jgi:cobalt-zinc-cadmium resistance protein CzcA